mgnify:CR=1 FL=1
MKEAYPAFIKKNGKDFLVFVPDWEIYTEGSSFVDAIEMARDAIELKCVSMEDDKEIIPEPSKITDLNIDTGVFSDEGETMISYVDIDSTLYRRQIDMKTVRRNVSLPSWLNNAAESAGVNVSNILQEALISKLKLERRM